MEINVLDIYYMNAMYVMVVDIKNDKIKTYNQFGEYVTYDKSDMYAADYKGSLLEEVRLIRLIR